MKNELLQSAVERNLQVAIQCMLDIGNHIIAEDEAPAPDTNDDIFRILRDARVMPTDFYDRIKGVGGFRNILVHNYLEVDVDLVYRFLQSDMDDFERFAELIVAYLDKAVE